MNISRRLQTPKDGESILAAPHLPGRTLAKRIGILMPMPKVDQVLVVYQVLVQLMPKVDQFLVVYQVLVQLMPKVDQFLVVYQCLVLDTLLEFLRLCSDLRHSLLYDDSISRSFFSKITVVCFFSRDT